VKIKILVVASAIIVIAVAGFILTQQGHSESNASAQVCGVVATQSVEQAPVKAVLPRMEDYGADKCVPCKIMIPILAELKTEYEGKVDIIFFDVWKDRSAGQRAKIRVIPTQLFFDATGKEVGRHEGFLSKEDIIAEWKKYSFIPDPK